MKRRSGTRQGSAPRRGFTLVEMLMVLAIIVLLLAAVLPFVRPALEGRRTREASREVNAFLASAQARAAEKGRPVGVWIERTERGSPACYNMFLAEVAPPYTGDALGATGALVDLSGDGVSDALVFDNNSASIPFLVRPGDLIRLNFRGPLYPIQSVRTVPDPSMVQVPLVTVGLPKVVWRVGADGVWGNVGDDDGVNGAEDFGERGWPGSDDIAIAPNIPMPSPDTDSDGWPEIGLGVQYQVYRQPTKSMAAPLTLPSGIAIDLNHSGMGAVGQQFRPANLPAAMPPILDDHPVIIMFQPSGPIEQIYYGEYIPAAMGPGSVELVGHTPVGTVHLLIGKTEQFVQKQADDNATAAETNFYLNNFVDENLADNGSLWVSVGHRTGNITSNSNGWALVGAPLDFVLSFGVAREFARSADHMGGK